MRILGIDPGTLNLGVAVFEDTALLWADHLKPPPRHRQDPIVYWFTTLAQITRTFYPEHVAFEEYVWQGAQRTSHNSPQMWELLGAIRILSTQIPFPTIWGYAPELWKAELTGNGHATKGEVSKTVEMRLGAPLVQSTGGHMSDAIGVAMVLHDHITFAQAARMTTQEYCEARRKQWRQSA